MSKEKIAEAAERLEKAEGDVAHALREVWHYFNIISHRGERIAALPVDEYEVLQDVMKAWTKASNAFFGSNCQNRARMSSDYLALRQAATEHERLALLSGCTEHNEMAQELRRRAVDLRLGSRRPPWRLS